MPVTMSSRYHRSLPTDGAILDYAGANQAFETLTSRGVDGEALLHQVRAIVLLTRLPVFKQEDWAKGSGKDRRTLKAFPARVRRLAGEIEGVNGHTLLAPALYSDEHGKMLYEKLPTILRAYSHWLQGHVSVIGRLVARLSRGRAFQYKLLLYLSEWVQRVTGGYFDEAVALLVTAAYTADKQEREVSGESLKALHSPDRRAIEPPRILQIDLDPAQRTVRLTVEP